MHSKSSINVTKSGFKGKPKSTLSSLINDVKPQYKKVNNSGGQDLMRNKRQKSVLLHQSESTPHLKPQSSVHTTV